MGRAILVLGILSAASAAAQCSSLAVSPGDLDGSCAGMTRDFARQKAASVVVVEFINEYDRLSYCQGVLVLDGFVLTNKHCVPRPDRPQTVTIVVVDLNGKEVKINGSVPAGFAPFQTMFPSEDLALIDMGVVGRNALAAAGAVEAFFGTIDGLAQGSGLLVHSGGAVVATTVSGLAQKSIEYFADTYPGWSGSPVFASDGRVVGIHARASNSFNPGAKEAVRLSFLTQDTSPDFGRDLIAELAMPTVMNSGAVQDPVDERYVRIELAWPVSTRTARATVVDADALWTPLTIRMTNSGPGRTVNHTLDVPYIWGDGVSHPYRLLVADPFPSRRRGNSFSFTLPFGSFSAGYPVIEMFSIEQSSGEYSIRVKDPTPNSRPATFNGARIELCAGNDCVSVHPFPRCGSGSGVCSLTSGGDAFASWNQAPNSQVGCSAAVGSCFSVSYSPNFSNPAKHPGAIVPFKWFSGFRYLTLRVRDTNSSVVAEWGQYFWNPPPAYQAYSGSCTCYGTSCQLAVSGTGVYDWNEFWQATNASAALAVGSPTAIQYRSSQAGSLNFSSVPFIDTCQGWFCPREVRWWVYIFETNRPADPNFSVNSAQYITQCFNGGF